jgi:hypothetical protein
MRALRRSEAIRKLRTLVPEENQHKLDAWLAEYTQELHASHYISGEFLDRLKAKAEECVNYQTKVVALDMGESLLEKGYIAVDKDDNLYDVCTYLSLFVIKP